MDIDPTREFELEIENAALKRALKSMFAKYENADAERDEAHTKQGDLEREVEDLKDRLEVLRDRL